MSRVTGLQAALVALNAQLEAWRQQMSPREYAVLRDLLLRRLTAELERQKRTGGRWVA